MSAAARTSSRLLASRSVHLRIQPRPANLSESREIFRVLQRFGEISTYKYLRYEYHNPAANTALAIYRDADAAQKAIDASPLRFALERIVHDGSDTETTGGTRTNGEYELGSEDANDTRHTPINTSIDEITRPSTLINRPPPPRPSRAPQSSQSQPNHTPMPFESPPSPPKTTSKWFQVTVDRSRVIHQDYVERQPYWKQFHPMKSLGQEDLAKAVPHVGLSDVSKRPPFAHRTPVQVLKKLSWRVENKWTSLGDLWEEGERERV